MIYLLLSIHQLCVVFYIYESLYPHERIWVLCFPGVTNKGTQTQGSLACSKSQRTETPVCLISKPTLLPTHHPLNNND